MSSNVGNNFLLGRQFSFDFNFRDTDKQLTDIVENIRQYKKKAKDRSKLVILSTERKVKKENFILSLKKDLEYHKEQNKRFLTYFDYTKTCASKYKTNLNDIQNYCNNLRSNFTDDMKLIESYEDKIKEIEEDRKLIHQTNNEIINLKLKEREGLNKRLDQINQKLTIINRQYQESLRKIQEITDKKAQLDKDVITTEKEFVRKTALYNEGIKFQKTKYEYYDEMFKEKFRDGFEISEAEKEFKECDDKIELQERLSKNANLKKLIAKLNKRIEVLKSEQLEEENEKKDERFFGSKLIGKVKERKLMNEKLKNINIKINNGKRNAKKSEMNHMRFNSESCSSHKSIKD